jgi:hypothetical protein
VVFKLCTTDDFHGCRKKVSFVVKLVNIMINHVCIFSTVTKRIVVLKFEHNPGVTSLTNQVFHMVLSLAGQYHWSLPVGCSVAQNWGWYVFTQSSMPCYRSHHGEVHPILVFCEEAWFRLSGYVTSKNKRYWFAENPMLIHELTIHDVTVGVWCAMNATRILVSIFSEIITSRRHVTFWQRKQLCSLSGKCFWRPNKKQGIATSCQLI